MKSMKILNRSTNCSKCSNKLKLKKVIYIKDLSPNSIIESFDVSDKEDRELHSYSASGFALKSKNMKAVDMGKFFKETTGISLLEKRIVCTNCGFYTETVG